RWLTPGVSGASFALARAAREVLLGADPPVALTQRAKRALADIRGEHVPTVHPAGTVIVRAGADVRWWTWAGYRANATLAATLSGLKFNEALPERLATATLAARLADLDSAARVLAEPARFTVVDEP